MSYDKLKDKIESIEYWQEHFANKTFIKALMSVIDLHKPLKADLTWCSCDYPFPCPTIQAIEKELK
jgi:hypothetical protein